MLKVAKTKQTKRTERTEPGPGTRARAGAENEWQVRGGSGGVKCRYSCVRYGLAATTHFEYECVLR